MKRFFLIIALIASSFAASAFEFDGINLNGSTNEIYRQIFNRGYTYNHDRNCLEGLCQGSRIYLSTNYIDVTEIGRLGQLIIEMPIEGDEAVAFANITSTFNVIYHQIPDSPVRTTYLVDKDGTQLVVSLKNGFIVLTYNTPYYKKAEK